jgi:murein lipoprotein
MMQKMLLALTSVALLGLSGCAGLYNQGGTPPAAAKPAEAAKPALSAEAAAALASAQADVKAAKAKNNLWTTADAALKAAETAAEAGDSATVIKQAKITSDHVKLGMAQAGYPMLKVGD